MTTPGLHDPYWYESTLGERFVVEMLNRSSGISSVTFQAPRIAGIDDLVVRYRDRPSACYQVKNTRSGESISFADLVRPQGRGPSLLRQLALGWKEQIERGHDCETHLFSNRQPGTRNATVRCGRRAIRLPPLLDFWEAIQPEVKRASILAEVRVAPGHRSAWRCLAEQTSELTDEQRLLFFRTLHIELAQPSLAALVDDVVARLQQIFAISPDKARDVLQSLDSALRTWTTSLRGEQFEVTPAVARNALKLNATESIGDHHLEPPAVLFPARVPFIESLGADLRSAKHSIIFLSGPAGSGKTSIVSSLARRAEPVIDLRFYAFRPLAPGSTMVPQDVGRTATAEALWGDLLVQLRETFFADRILEEEVPVRNDFFAGNPAGLQGHVLRLAQRLAERRVRPTVIAIDGIDHAARARRRAPERFLQGPLLIDFLVPPERVPPGVVFLIAGQPDDTYPGWLRSHPGVRRLTVPPITLEDIESDLRALSGSLPSEQIEAAARIIDTLTRGNTLSAVFGIHEARAFSNVAKLETHLRTRHLGSDLDDYYDTIWSAALAPFRRPAVDASLASALSVSSARLTGDLLAGFFPHLGLSASDWQIICRALAPIVEEEQGTFALRHNDPRVALTARLAKMSEAFRDAASRMADFLIQAPPTDEKYLDLFRLLEHAGRQQKMPRVFTPKFVVEASALDRPIDELMEYARRASEHVSPALGWQGLHELGLALASLQQLRMIDEQGRRPSRTTSPPALLPSEALASPRHSWTKEMWVEIFRDADRLVRASQAGRASRLLTQLLGDCSIEDVAALYDAAAEEEDENRHPDWGEQVGLPGILRGWGGIAQRIGLPRSIAESPEGNVLRSFFGGWLFAGIENRDRPWSETLDAARSFYDFDIEDYCAALAADDRWKDVTGTLHRLTPVYDTLPPSLRIQGGAWAFRTGDETLADPWIKRVTESGLALVQSHARRRIDERITRGTLEGPEVRSEPDALDLLVPMAYIVGASHPASIDPGIVQEGLRIWEERRDFGRRDAVRQLLGIAIWSGRLAASFRAHGAAALEEVPPHELRQNVESLLFMPPGALGHFRNGPMLLRDVLQIARSSGSTVHADAVMQPLLRYADRRLWGHYLDLVWTTLYEWGETDRLRQWLLHWIGPEGKTWTGEFTSREDAVREFGRLGRLAGFEAEVAAAEERLRWNFIAYSGHKEYALHTPLEWFELARHRTPKVWETAGARLLSISREASREGGNRLSGDVEASIASAAASVSPNDLCRLLRGISGENSPLAPSPRDSAIEGMIGALESADLSEDDLTSMWRAAVDTLTWQNPHDRIFLCDVRDAIVAASARLGLDRIPDHLRSIAPTAFKLHRPDSTGYGFPSRWFAPADEPHPEHDALTLELRGLPLAEAIGKLKPALHFASQDRLGSTGGVWRAAAACTKRLVAEKPAGFRSHLRSLIELASLRDLPYGWSFDDFAKFAREVIPLMSEQERWTLGEQMLSTMAFASERATWLYAVAENLRTLCQVNASSGDGELVNAGLNAELRTQELWIRGPNGENRPRWPLYAWPACDGLASWPDLVASPFFRSLRLREAATS